MNATCTQRMLESLLAQLTGVSKDAQAMLEYIKTSPTEEIRKRKCAHLEGCVHRMMVLVDGLHTTLLNFDCSDMGENPPVEERHDK